jgi:lipopolysaccharide transport system ATP-binding protein
MTSDQVIAVSGLSKRYQIGQLHHDTLRDRISHVFHGKSASPPSEQAAEFWALNDVSFEVARGDAIGVVGRNGAGKSTLLKILSRITEPTRGRATIRGRVASLLEVGTGFHAELSGRENIYLNGAILGMRRSEIRARFDEIVAFAEVERFLDLPVKHYSSGMYVRLAFAVAAHLDAEILIIDEVLAVGDAQFQKKCLQKVGDVSRESGRTVLFVSHNASALLNVCRRGIWLDEGRIARQGPIAEVLASYLQGGSRLETRFAHKADQPHITFVQVDADALAEGRLAINVGFSSPYPLNPPVVGIILSTKLGQPISGFNGRMAGSAWRPTASSAGVVTAHIDTPPLHSDTYRVSVWLGDAHNDYDDRRDAVDFEFVSRNFYPESPPVEFMGSVDLPWRLTFRPSDGALPEEG